MTRTQVLAAEIKSKNDTTRRKKRRGNIFFGAGLAAFVAGAAISSIVYTADQPTPDSAQTPLQKVIDDRGDMINAYRNLLAKSRWVVCTETWPPDPIAVICKPRQPHPATTPTYHAPKEMTGRP